MNVPVGLLALAFGVLFLADQDHPAAGRFDVAGFVTSSLGLGLLTYGAPTMIRHRRDTPAGAAAGSALLAEGTPAASAD